MTTFQLGKRKIGPGQPCFVIAEAGVNHDGEVDRALDLIDAAAEAGADAVKFQTFSVDRLVTPDAPQARYQRRGASARTQAEMLSGLVLPTDAYPLLMERCRQKDIHFLSSPFSEEDAEILQELGVPAFKLASGELTNLPLLQHLAGMGKPLIVSTGMATLEEVAEALEVIKKEGDPPVVLLHCVSVYPAPVDAANVIAMVSMRDRFQVDVGYSDHSLEHEPALAAVALGATVLERHLTLDRTARGPDHAMSSDPADLHRYVQAVRRIETAIGHGRKEPSLLENEVREVVRRSVAAARNIEEGTTLTSSDLILLRPGSGISPAQISDLIGRRTARPITRGALIKWEMLD